MLNKCLAILLILFILLNCFTNVFASAFISGTNDGTYIDFSDYAYNSAVLTIGNKTYAFEAVRLTGIKVVDITDTLSPYAITTTSSPIKYSDATKENPYKAADTINDPYHSVCARTEGADSYIYTMLSYTNAVDYTVPVGTTKYKVRRIKVTDPTNPVLIAEYVVANADLAYARDIKVDGGFIYTAGGNVCIFDATLTSGIGASANNKLTSITTKMYSIEKQGNYIYGVDYTYKNFKVVKMTSDPGTAQFAYSEYTRPLVSFLPNNATLRGVAIIGDYAYICSSDMNTEASNTMFAIDLSKRDSATTFPTSDVWAFRPATSLITSPTYISTLNTTWVRPYSIQADGNILYIADLNKRIWIYDVSDTPTEPSLITSKQSLTKKAYSLSVNSSNVFVSSEGDKRFSIFNLTKTIGNIRITSPKLNSTITTAPLVVTGKSAGGDNIKLTLNTGNAVSVTPDASGDWSYQFANAPDGTNSLKADLYSGSTLKSSTIIAFNVILAENNLLNAQIDNGDAYENICDVGGVQIDDSLQLALKRNQVTITSSTGGNTAAIADSLASSNVNAYLDTMPTAASSSNIDVKFKAEYAGGRNIKDIFVVLNAVPSATSTSYDMAIYYSEKTAPTVFIKIFNYLEWQSTDNSFPYVRLTGLDEQMADVDTIRLVLNKRGDFPYRISEVDINDSIDSPDIAAEKQANKDKITMPTIFSDNMMMQRNKKVSVWGKGGRDGEEVNVNLNGQNKVAIIQNRKWSVELDPISAGGPYVMTVEGQHNTLTINNILVGEVWLASGQSNMWYTCNSLLSEANKSTYTPPYNINKTEQITRMTNDIANSADPSLRFFTQTQLYLTQPWDDSYKGSWNQATPTTVGNFSATGYYFARELRAKLGADVPVGVILEAVPGTGAELWVDKKVIDSDASFSIYKSTGSRLFNGMIAPIQPFGIQGVIWYQGEANANSSTIYAKLFPALIEDWRDGFKQTDMPFLFVQLAPYNTNWTLIREVQLQTMLTVPNTAMAVITDAGNPIDIHPKDKKSLGERLAQAALSKAYQSSLEYCGPLYQTMQIVGSKLVLSFTHTGSGLAKMPNDILLNGFEISSDGTTFVSAIATIVGDKVEVSAPTITAPIAVRYGWNIDAKKITDPVSANLANVEGFPATPFRALAPIFKINSVKYYNSSNIEIINNTLPATGDLKVKIDYKNSGTILSKIIITSYDCNNKIVDVKSLPSVYDYTLNKALEQTIKLGNIGVDRTNGKIKIAVWTDLQSIQPVMQQFTYPVK